MKRVCFWLCGYFHSFPLCFLAKLGKWLPSWCLQLLTQQKEPDYGQTSNDWLRKGNCLLWLYLAIMHFSLLLWMYKHHLLHFVGNFPHLFGYYQVTRIFSFFLSSSSDLHYILSQRMFRSSNSIMSKARTRSLNKLRMLSEVGNFPLWRISISTLLKTCHENGILKNNFFGPKYIMDFEPIWRVGGFGYVCLLDKLFGLDCFNIWSLNSVQAWPI